MNHLPFAGHFPVEGDSHSSYVLLTGGTGLLGRYLLRDLLNQGFNVAVLARPGSNGNSAVNRVNSILQSWGLASDLMESRVVVLQGDVSQKSLGLNQADQLWIGRNVTGLIHSAALIRFDLDPASGEPQTTNYRGTQNVLKLVRQFDIRDFHYVSTAFVCGDRDGLILESDLDSSQGFHNAYEKSKFHSELEIRNADSVPFRTIYRPTIITGDSATGYTSSYFGIMWYLKLLSVLVPQQPKDANGILQTPIHLPISGTEPHNFVPVDWVSRMIVELFSNPLSRNQTFHLANRHALIMRTVVEVCCEYFQSSGVRFAGDPDWNPNEVTDFSASFMQSSQIYRDYDGFTPAFDRSNLETLIPNDQCPAIDKAMLLRFLEFGNRDRWGKRSKKSERMDSRTTAVSTAHDKTMVPSQI